MHAFLNLLFCVLAVAACALLGVAKDSILKAFTVLLLAVRLFATTAANVLGRDVCLVCALD